MLLPSAAAFRSGTKYSVAQAEAQSNFTNLVGTWASLLPRWGKRNFFGVCRALAWWGHWKKTKIAWSGKVFLFLCQILGWYIMMVNGSDCICIVETLLPHFLVLDIATLFARTNLEHKLLYPHQRLYQYAYSVMNLGVQHCLVQVFLL